MRGELGEPHWLPELGEVVVHEAVERAVDERQLALEDRAVGVVGRRPPLREEAVELLRLLRALERRSDPARMPQTCVAQHPAEVAAGLHVVRDVRNSTRREARRDRRQQRVVGVGGIHP